MKSQIERTHETDETQDEPFPQHAEMGHYLHTTDEAAVSALEKRYGHLVPADRIRAMRELPTEFDDRASFDKYIEGITGDKPKQGERILGVSRRTMEAAHVAIDHTEIPKTVYHERLHQLADPSAADKLGHGLQEGITEELAIENLGTAGREPLDECYPEERSIAHQIREQCGDGAIESAYFQGDTRELRRCLDERFGAPGLERLRDLLDQN